MLLLMPSLQQLSSLLQPKSTVHLRVSSSISVAVRRSAVRIDQHVHCDTRSILATAIEEGLSALLGNGINVAPADDISTGRGRPLRLRSVERRGGEEGQRGEGGSSAERDTQQNDY